MQAGPVIDVAEPSGMNLVFRPVWLLRAALLTVFYALGAFALVAGFTGVASGGGSVAVVVVGAMLLVIAEAGRRLTGAQPTPDVDDSGAVMAAPGALEYLIADAVDRTEVVDADPIDAAPE